MTNLKSRRNQLAHEYCYSSTNYGDFMPFKSGFDAAISELKPEIEKLVKALEFYAARHVDDCLWDWRGVSAAREALTKFKEFMGDGE